MKPVVFPGSFDPVTNGHIDLIKRARAIFGSVVVVVCCNAAKQGMFTLQERLAFLQTALAGEKDITVDSTPGLLAAYLKQHGYTTVVRGLRSAHDWNHERTNAYFNKEFYPALETLFLPASQAHVFVSSSMVKEAAHFGADVSAWVPACVAAALQDKKNLL